MSRHLLESGPVGLGAADVVGPCLDDARCPFGPTVDGEVELLEELSRQDQPGQPLGVRSPRPVAAI